MNIAKIIEEHKNSFLKAKDELEASRIKQPDREFPVKAKKRTLNVLRARVVNLTKARDEAVQDFTARIKSVEKDIVRLENEIKKTENSVGVNIKKRPTKKKST